MTTLLGPFNAASHVEAPLRRPKAIVWTAEQVSEGSTSLIRHTASPKTGCTTLRRQDSNLDIGTKSLAPWR